MRNFLLTISPTLDFISCGMFALFRTTFAKSNENQLEAF